MIIGIVMILGNITDFMNLLDSFDNSKFKCGYCGDYFEKDKFLQASIPPIEEDICRQCYEQLEYEQEREKMHEQEYNEEMRRLYGEDY